MEDGVGFAAPAHVHDVSHVEEDNHLLASLVEGLAKNVEVCFFGLREIPVAGGEGAVSAFAGHASDAVDADVVAPGGSLGLSRADDRFLHRGNNPEVLGRLFGLLCLHILAVGGRNLLVQPEAGRFQPFVYRHLVGAVHIAGTGTAHHGVVGRNAKKGPVLHFHCFNIAF